MNVLLIQPHFKKSEKAYPLGLGYIGAVLKQKGHKVFGADLSFVSMNDAGRIINAKNIEFIGISLLSYSFKDALSFCQKIKKYKPLPIAAGGPHATVFREELFYDYKGCFDYLIVGEGESAFLELLTSLEKGISLERVSSLIYRDNGRIVINERGSEEESIDGLPFPDRNIFSIFKYKGMSTRFGDYTQIITSRGCNHHCRYCPESTLWKKWRGHSIDKVIQEIKSIMKDFGIREFHIEDSNFFGGGTERIKEFCLKLREEKLNIKWQCPNGIPIMDFGDESILELMAQAGCYNVCLGIESFDNEILNNMGRSSNFNKIKRIVKISHEVGIKVIGYFMIGFPAQTFKSIANDIFLSKRLNLDFIHYSIFHLIPGSSIYYDYSLKFKHSDIVDKKVSVSKVSLKSLRKIRILFILLNFLSPRCFWYALQSLIIIRNPLKFLHRAINFLLDKDFSSLIQL